MQPLSINERFEDFETTAFPDLTGRSPLGKDGLSDRGLATRSLGVDLGDLEGASKALSISINALFAAAWTKVLTAYVGESDVCVGWMRSEPSSTSDNGDGNVANSAIMPLRARLGTQSTNAELLRQLDQQLQFNAGSTLAESYRTNSERAGLFDTCISFGPQMPNVGGSHTTTDLQTLAIFLHVESVEANGQHLHAHIHFQRSILLSEDTQIVLSTFEAALLSAIRYPGSLALGWDSLNAPLFSISNGEFRRVQPDYGETILDSVAYHSKHHPKRHALDFLHADGSRTVWTFEELHAFGVRIAETLIEGFGVIPEASIPICIPKSPSFYAAILGVMMAGASFTPFSDAPNERKAFMLQELGAQTVLYVDGEDMSWCHKTRILNVSTLLAGSKSHKNTSEPAKPLVKPGNLVYQMYTSGSTGRPKAVSLEHGHVIQTVAASKHSVPWNLDSRMLQYAAPSFDMCYYDTFLSWYLGICLCSAPSEAVYNDLPGTINALEVSMLGLTPSVAATLDPVKVPGVQWIYCIGEAMPQSLVNTWSGKLVNSYGPTEAAQMVTLFPVQKEVSSSVIGTPFVNTTFRVIKEGSDTPVPVLGVGELHIGGLQVAREYFANREKTEQCFVSRAGTRLYRTGDNVRMLGNGTFEFIGRTDDQVKLRGQRVELGEVSEVIRQSSAVVRGVSSQILKVSAQAKEQLVAFIAVGDEMSQEDQASTRQIISTYLASRLPAYMVPKMLLFVRQIPLSKAGKVNKRVLQEILQSSATSPDKELPVDSDPQGSETEDIVRQIFANFSGSTITQLGNDTTIFHLGLDSISAIQMASAFQNKGLNVNASMILGNPSVQKLTCVLDGDSKLPHASEDELAFDFTSFDQRHRPSIIESHEIPPNTVESIYPATALQSGMVAMSIHSAGRLYFNHMTYKVRQDLDASLLAAAWATVAAKYAILRSGFVHVDDSTHPIAMITYNPDAYRYPIEVQSAEPIDVDSWRKEMVQSTLKQLQLPPWRVLIAPGKMQISAHHAIYDAQVLDIILRDLEISYKGLTLSEAAPVEPQLARCLSGAAGNSQSDSFWKSVGEKTFVTRLPTLTPLKVIDQSAKEVSLKCTLDREQLEQGCRKHGITMQVAGQAAWGRLISAYTGEHEITFGTVLSGRTTEGSEEIGLPSIATIPTPIHAGKSKQELLRDLMGFSANVQQHQYVPLKRIEQITGHSNEALFDTIFTYQKRPNTGQSESMFSFVKNELVIDYPLSIEIEPVDHDTLELRLYHRVDRVPVEQAQLMIEQFDEMICETLGDSTHWAPPKIDHASPRLYSMTPPEFPYLEHEAKVLHDFVEISTRQTPHKPALEFVYNIPDAGAIDRKTWTYEELSLESNRVANMLRAKGVLQGSVVGVCFDKCPEAAFTMLGISKLGCSFLAIDAGAPIERKKFIMSDSKAAALVTKGSVVDGLEAQPDALVLNLDHVDTQLFSSEAPKLDRPIDPQELSYCLYTSGTTGTPKGCAITHENVVQVFLSFHRLYRWNDQSRWLQFASYHFDVSVMEHFWSWSVGMTVVVASRDLVFADLAGTIKRLEITHTDLTPSLARLLDPEDVPSLAGGVFVTGGEMLRQEVIDKFGPHGAIHNAYGPTEATIGCTMYPGVPKDGKPSNIGWHFPVAGSFIVDPQDPNKPVLRGAVGEFVVSGKLVAQGYIGRPDLTKEKFITLNGERCYRTGDLVRILHNNTFDFVGRADDQVKLRGQRLEIGEINSVIRKRTDEVLDVTTQVLKHPKQQKEQLISFVAVAEASGKDNKSSHIIDQNTPRDLLADLKRACREKLPQYMIPTHILPVNKLPLSANNKADAKQLKSLYEQTSIEVLQNLSRTEAAQDVTNPHSEEQSRIVTVLSKFLKMDAEQISGDSSFFELGLDSISVISFARQVRATGLANVSTAVIMECSTPSRLANALSGVSSLDSVEQDGSICAAKQTILACQHRCRAFAASALAVPQDAIEAVAPCTPLQQGIISRALKSDNGIYYGAFHFDLKADVKLLRLKIAFQKAVDQVQTLRTKFVPTDDGHVQVVLAKDDLPWSEFEVADDELEAHLNSCFNAWRDQGTDIITRPVEVAVTKTSGGCVLTLHIFHACYDGNSLPLLVHSLLGEYHSADSVEYGPRFHDILPYGPLREVKGAETFWRRHLKASSAISRLDFPALTIDGSEKPISITRAVPVITGLEKCRRKLNVTPQALFQACWGALLQEAIARPLVQGVVVSGRSIDFEGAEKAIGPLFNTVPFLLDLKQSDSWQDVVRRCHEFNMSALPFQHTALRDIQKWNPHLRAAGDASLFETLFVFQKELDGPHYPTIWDFRGDQFDADYALALEIEQTKDDAYNFTLVTQAGVSDLETSTNLLRSLENVLNELIDDVHASVSARVSVHELPTEENESTNGHHENGNGDAKSSTNGHASGSMPNGGSFIWTDSKRVVRDEIAKLAGVDADSLSPHTSILELGLDSVDAVKLSSRLNRAAGIKITVSTIMRSLTIGKIASIGVEEQKHLSSSSPGDSAFDRLRDQLAPYAQRHVLLTNNVERILPSTPLQEGIVVDMISSDLKKYFNHDVLKLSLHTNIAEMKKAWRYVVDCTPVLRTRFVQVDDPEIDCTVAQVVFRAQPLAWLEYTIESNETFEAVLENIRQDTAANLDSSPPFRLTMIHRAGNPEPEYLVLSLSHAMYDGWSLALLHTDVQRAYKHTLPARGSFEPALKYIIDSSGGDSHSYWQQALRDISRSTISKRQQSNTASEQTHRCELRCSRSANDIQRFCKVQQTTVAALSQTIWSFVLSSRLKQLDVAFSTVLSGRDNEQTNDVAFPTMNTIIARSVIHGTRVEMLHYTQSNISAVSDHQHFPLRKALAIAKGKHAGELVNSLFIYQGRPKVPDTGNALYESVSGASDEGIPIAVEAEVGDGAFIWRIAAKDDYFTEIETNAILQDLEAVTSEVLDHPNDDAVSFESNKVSVCGLPPFGLTAETNGSHNELSVEEQQAAIDESSAVETQVQSIIAMVARLDKSEVRKNSSLLSLGLDSISAIKVSALLRKVGLGLTVNELLKAETVANIAKQARPLTGINGQAGHGHGHDNDQNDLQHRESLQQLVEPLLLDALRKAELPREAFEVAGPATPGQTLMLAKWQNQDLYLPTLAFQIEGASSAEVICQSWKVLVEHTAILRTVFVASQNERLPLLQVVMNSSHKSTLTTIVSSSASLDAAVREFYQQNTGQSITPTPTALFVQSGPSNRVQARLRLSHALYDGYSINLIFDQFQTLLKGQAPRVDSTFSHYYSYLVRTIKGEKSRKGFWTQYFAGLNPKALPKATDSSITRYHVVRSNAVPRVSHLHRSVRKTGLTIQSLFLAAYAQLYARLAGAGHDEDVVIGAYIANRNFEGADELDAPTLGFVPLRVKGAKQRELVDVATQLQNDFRQIAQETRGSVSLQELRQWVGPGLTVDNWVNLILEEDSVSASSNEPTVVFAEDRIDKDEEYTIRHNEEDKTHGLFLRGNPVQQLYHDSIDIDGTISTDSMDIGVLGPDTLTDRRRIGEIVSGISERLVHFVDSN